MIPVSEEFLEVIRNSHQITSLMVFYDWDEDIAFTIEDYDHLQTYEPDMRTPITPATYDGIQADYTDYDDIRNYVGSNGSLVTNGYVAKVVSGSVTADRTGNARRSFSSEIALHAWEDIPVNIVTSRVQIWTGVLMGSMEMMIPIGVFRVDSIGRVNAETLSISGSSLEEFVIEDKWLAAGQIDKGTPIISKIQSLVSGSIPGDVQWIVTPEARSRDEALPYDTPLELGASKWDAVLALAFDIECDVFCDPTGKFVIDERPKFTEPHPVATLTEGADGVLVAVNTQATREKMHNAVVVTSENSSGDDTVTHSGMAKDDDPNSPTRYGGPYGKNPIVQDVKGLKSDDACEKKAEELLAEYKAESRTLDFSAIPNPALEPDDFVAVSMLDGTYETHLITRIEIPMGISGGWMADTMAAKDDDRITNPDRPIAIPKPDDLATQYEVLQAAVTVI